MSALRIESSLLRRGSLAFIAAATLSIASSCTDSATAPTGAKAGQPENTAASLAQAAQDLRITPSTDTIFVGQAFDLSVVNSNGTTISKQAVWTSSDTTIAKVVSTGFSTARVTGRRVGMVTITAVSGPRQGTNITWVRLVPVRSVMVTPDTISIPLADSVQYTATPRDSAGNPLTGRAVTWSVTDASVATINAAGRAYSRARGATQVLATVEGVVGFANALRVRVPDLTVTFSTPLDSANAGDTLSVTYVSHNAGDASQPDSTYVRVGIRNAGGAIVTAVRRAIPRQTGGSYADVARFIVPSNLTAGSYSLVAYVDCKDVTGSTNEAVLAGCLAARNESIGMIREGNETDNSVASGLIVRGPDLVAVKVTTPDSIFTRTQVTVSLDVTNTGSATAAGFDVIATLYDATSFSYSQATAVTTGALGSRLSRSVDVVLSIPSGLDPAHTYQVVAYADCPLNGGAPTTRLTTCLGNPTQPGAIAESIENNNSAKRAVPVASNVVRIDAVPDSISFTALGDTLRLVATAYDRAGSQVSGVFFTYTSLNPTIVSATAPNLAGYLLRALAPGFARIVVSADGRTDTTRVFVVQRATRVTLMPDSISLNAIGDTTGFAARAYDRNDNLIAGAPMTWSALDPSVATVAASGGLITATGFGRARIVATSGLSADTGIVNVTQAPARVVVSPDALLLLAIGDTARLTATVYDGNNNPMPAAAVSWTVSEPIVARVGTTGLVTARANGTSLVIASSGGRADTARVDVYLRVTRIVAAPDTMLVEALMPTVYGPAFTAVSYDHNGNAIEGAWVTWLALDPAIATINEHGAVSAKTNGYARMTATNLVSSVADTVIVHVYQTAAYIRLTPDSTVLSAGGTATVSAILEDSLHNVINEPRTVGWTSLDPGIATVSGTTTGQVIGVSAGVARIVGTIAGGWSDTVIVVVSAPTESAAVMHLSSAERPARNDPLPLSPIDGIRKLEYVAAEARAAGGRGAEREAIR